MDDITCDEFLEAQISKNADFLDNNVFSTENDNDDMLKEFEKYGKMILRGKKTNNYGPIIKYVNTPRFIDHFGPHKENSCPNIGNDHGKTNSNTKSRLVKVKTEKLSISSDASIQSVRDDTENMPAPKMIPPKTRRVKKEKVSILKNVKEEPISENNSSEGSKRVTRSRVDRTSDVILENPVVPVVDLRDSFDKTEEVPIRSTRTRTKKKEEAAPIRSTRTRTKKALDTEENAEPTEQAPRTTRTKTRTKRERSESEIENGILDHKRSKSNSAEVDDPLRNDNSYTGAGNKLVNISSHTEYEDAVSQVENQPNVTFVVPPQDNLNEQQWKVNKAIMNETVVIDKAIMNETVVIDKPKTQETVTNNTNELITDDESIDEHVVASPKQKVKQVNPNHVFSPYGNSPVKMKVQAFEQFQKHENATSSKMNLSKSLKEIVEGNKGNVKEKAKGFVNNPSTHKTNPPSASKIGKYIGHKTSISNNSMYKSTTPQSGHCFKERELKRQEKEKEQKKKEMLKQSLTEERKKKYEEKVLRVQQQQKEALEKEKEKALELQRIKDERYKMVLQQKEEKQRLLKEENERKRLLAKQRAEEKRKEEEALRLATQEKKDQKRRIESDIAKKAGEPTPVYLQHPTPPLPCHDCYDSDDERYTEKKNIPVWASKSNKGKQDYIQMAVGRKIKNTLFCCHSQNIDLRDVFQRIDPKKLKRTSSANWEKPPRFTLLPSTSEDD